MTVTILFSSLESNKETIKNYAIVTKSSGVSNGVKDKRSSVDEAAVDNDALSAPPADSATGMVARWL